MMTREKIKKEIMKIIHFFANPRLVLCIGIGWLITNGWSYIMFAIGTLLQIHWMIAVSGAYLIFLWFPFTPEKIVTVIIGMFLLKRWFPNDKQTLGVLHELHQKAREKWKNRKQEKK